ncbi:enolase C-terminal domain-like protein [Brenneria izbisi]|uniref:Mandelate racemase/muconate lactonizing enzyme C-terminal domain-containing protein n=1 Tax=Brenneria izbisi TaxID=2939450 RepID=A0AA41XVI2_9GAMM|nr:enolase C-terminal domain-like protein [Brenneria izbisi]MCV9877500.1 hypothetical protein [Brenneria izbisi]MCV9880934.1 hypothetical protein [Brenneria izbisi]
MLRAFIYNVDQEMETSFGHAAKIRRNAESVILKLEMEDLRGLGECAPRKYVTGETCQSVIKAAEYVNLHHIHLLLMNLDSYELVRFLYENGTANVLKLPPGKNVECLFELAFLDLLAQKEKVSVSQLIHKALNKFDEPLACKTVKFTKVIDFTCVDKSNLGDLKEASVIKIKVDNDINRTVNLVKQLREEVGPETIIIIDANMSWSRSLALLHMDALKNDHGIIYEEPIKKGDFEGLMALRQRTGSKVMLDESLTGIDDAIASLANKSCELFNIRLAKCGGILSALRLIEFARKHNYQYQIGVQVAEVGPLIAAERQLALLCSDFITMEAGQYDLFFKDMIICPIPLIDRASLSIQLTSLCKGFGVVPSKELTRFTFKAITNPNLNNEFA